MRYLSWDNSSTHGKILFIPELRALHGAGLGVGFNWEYSATDAKGGAAAGRIQGTEAVAQAKVRGLPKGKCIYFSVDWDTTPGDQAVINSYFSAARAICHSAGYRIGMYGGYWPLSRAFNSGVIDDGWQTYAWSGGNWDSRAAIRQVRNNVNIAGGACDINEFVAGKDSHIWFPGDSITPVSPTPTNTGDEVSAEDIAAIKSVCGHIEWVSVDTMENVNRVKVKLAELETKVDALESGGGGTVNLTQEQIIEALKVFFSKATA